jgi:hypothetical protein
MTVRHALALIVPVTLTALAPAASAHPTGHDGEPAPLHVDDSYDECFFDLHPELTQSEFDRFAKEGSMVMHDHQLTSAEAIGQGEVAVSLDYTRTAVDDSKGAWNNTMSHPTEDHYLGHSFAFPRLGVAVGVSRRVDVGAWGTLSPGANYGFVGISSKVTLLEQDDRMPVSVAVRPTAVSLLGPDELFVADAGVDVSVSRNFNGLSPYLGFNGHTAIAFERSDEVELDNGTASYLAAFVGVSYAWKKLRLAAEAEAGPLTTYAARLGGSF